MKMNDVEHRIETYLQGTRFTKSGDFSARTEKIRKIFGMKISLMNSKVQSEGH